MGKYEILYIVHPDLEASIDKITDRVRSFIEDRSGKITYEENWGKRKLAYEIKKSEVGIYLLWYFEAPAENLAKIERDLRLTEEVIRYMILAKSEKIAAPKAVKKEKPTVEVKTEAKPAPKTKKETVAKTKVVKKEKPAVENEAERMKELDEKLGAILSPESDNKKVSTKVKKEKK